MHHEELSRELRARGLVLLGVSQYRSNPDAFVVYLHGNAGQWIDGTALCLVAQTPGVVAVTESVQSPSILLVCVEPTTGSMDPAEGGDDVTTA